jgi:TRAP-type C4-dicarboxylate transport system substrate-binding protein
MRRCDSGAQHRVMSRATLLAVLLTAAVVSGCASPSGGSRNKVGAKAPPGSQVLHLESTDGGSPEALHFAERVKEHSRGTVTVDIRQSYPASLPANEARLARDLRAGKVDFGLLPARAWPAAGVPAFAALQAPFVLGNYDVARRAVAGAAGDVLKGALVQAGVTPLALAPTQLRRVLAVRPVATLADFRDLRVRINDNATSAAGLRALGAKPLEGLSNDEVRMAFRQSQLDGVETAPIWALQSTYVSDARHMTGYALFDRVDTLVASAAAWRHLPDKQKHAVRAAAEDAVRFAGSLPERDNADLVELCRHGVRVTVPTPADLRAISDAAEPVRAALRADPATGQVLRLLEATPGAGPQVLQPPAACTASGQGTAAATGAADIPNGVYVVTTTRDDYQSRGQYGGGWDAPAYTWTTTLRDGKWTRTVVPRFAGQVGDLDSAGTYLVQGDQVSFSYTFPHVDASEPETLRWSYYKGRLTLQVVDVIDLGARIIYSAHPWQKVR